MKSDVMRILTKDGVTFMRFKIFDGLDFINHAVSTRHGGVSDGECLKTLNLGFKTDDDPKNVVENYRRFCRAAGFDENRLVFAKQTHSANVRLATQSDCGKGIFRERDYTDVDASVTNEVNVPLVIHTADCVPVAFADVKNKAIGNAHCGWRGMFDRLAEVTLKKMQAEFGTEPQDVVCTIGPCICKKCYEVSEDLYVKFKEKFGYGDAICAEGGKYFLDLALINKHILTECGVLEKNIAVCDLCTCCNRDDLFSHRGLGAKRGLLSSIISIRV